MQLNVNLNPGYSVMLYQLQLFVIKSFFSSVFHANVFHAFSDLFSRYNVELQH
jgi:hypothetical protein